MPSHNLRLRVPTDDHCVEESFRSLGRITIQHLHSSMVTSELPIMPSYFDIRKDYQKAGVTGTMIKTGMNIVNSRTWNVHEWTKT